MSGYRKLMLGIAAILLLVACGGEGGGATMAPATTVADQQLDATAKLLEVELSIYKFKPSSLTIKLGEPVQFKATSISGVHTFTVKDLGIEVDLTKKPKDTKISEVFIPPADR